MPVTEDEPILDLFDHETIAVVGFSTTESKAAHTVPAFMQSRGYQIVPVNPFADSVLGQHAYDSILDVDPDVDVVNVFRPTEDIPKVVDEELERRESREDVRALWLQLGIRHDEAAQRAEAAGIQVVQDRCMRTEYRRLVE